MGDFESVFKRAHTDFDEYEEDVIAEILVRLLVKDLVRFRCVCKSWRALISSSYFVKKHMSYSQIYKLNFMLDPPLFLDLDGNFAVTEVQCPVINTILDSRYRDVVGSCNGFICVQADNLKAIMIWNPCTREFKVLPKLPRVNLSDGRYCLCGFGYDSANDNYKVIVGFTSSKSPVVKIMIDIFSLKADSWRTLDDIDYVPTMWQGLFSNGALHWLYSLMGGGSRILSFELREEKFEKKIPLPSDDWFYDSLIHENCLCVVNLPPGAETYNIWMMKEYGVKESWTEVAQFSLNVIGSYDYRAYFTPVCIFENGVVMIDMMGTCERLFVLPNVKEKTMKYLDDFVEESFLKNQSFTERH